MDNATKDRLAHTLNYHDTGSPTEADVQALWRAYKALEVERDELRIYQRVVEVAGITHFDQTGSPAETITRLQAERDQAAPVLAAAEAWRAARPDAWRWAEGALASAVDTWRAAREG